MSALYHQVALLHWEKYSIQKTLQVGSFHGVNTLNFAILHPYFPMDFFPSNMSICKLWQKHNYALETHELNFPQMETFKGNPMVFSNVCLCVQQTPRTRLVKQHLGDFSLSPQPHQTCTSGHTSSFY